MGGAPSLIGREAELDELRAMIARARDGSGGIAFIEGEPGIGKTRLCAAAVEHAQAEGFAVVRGGASALEAERPFGAFADAFGLTSSADDARLASIGDLIHGRDRSDTRFLAVERISDLVEERALDGPQLIAVEDLHWADPSTLLVVQRLAATIDHQGVVLIATLRPTPRSAELQGLLERVRARGARMVSLDPVTPEQVRAIASSLLEGEPGPHLRTMLDGAGGNPLFVTEVVGALRQEGLLQRDGAVVDVGQATLPPSVTLTILRRLTYLSDETLEMLRIASVLGSSFSLTDLSRVMGKATPELLPLIDEAAKSGVLGEDTTSLTFRHDLIRDAIYDDMLTPVRTALHHRVARALMDAGAPAMRIAPHVSLGAEPGDAEAIAWLRETALSMLPQPQAADLMSRAIELAGDAADTTMLGQRIELLLASGRTGEALRFAERAVAERQDRRIRHLLAITLGATWQFRASVDVCESMIEKQEGSLEELLGIRAMAAIQRTAFDRPRAESEARAVLAEAPADSYVVEIAQTALTISRLRDGYVGDVTKVYSNRSYTALTIPDGVLPDASLGVIPLGPNVLGDDNIMDSLRAIENLRETANDMPNKMAMYHWQRSALEMARARWDDAIAFGEAGLGLSEEAGNAHAGSMIHEVLCYIATHRGDHDRARRHLDAIPSAMWTRAVLAEATGDDALLTEALDGMRRSIGSEQPWVMPTMWLVGPDWVRIYTEAGDRESARILTEVVEEGARRAKIATAEGAALRCRGLIEADAELLLGAVERHRGGPRPFVTAQTCEDAAVALAATGAKDDAIELLREALDVYQSVDAAHDVARADARLRELGVRRGKGAGAARPKFGWDSLTDSERKVAALVPDGLTYREIGERLFISKRTVETHIAHVFAKLQIGSRRELAEEVRRRS